MCVISLISEILNFLKEFLKKKNITSLSLFISINLRRLRELQENYASIYHYEEIYLSLFTMLKDVLTKNQDVDLSQIILNSYIIDNNELALLSILLPYLGKTLQNRDLMMVNSAMSKRNFQMVELLLTSVVVQESIRQKTEYHILKMACSIFCGEISIVKILLKHGVDKTDIESIYTDVQRLKNNEIGNLLHDVIPEIEICIP